MSKKLSLKSQIFRDLLNLCDEETQLAILKENYSHLEYIKNPSEKVKLAAVKENGYAIQYIQNPSKDIQKEAIKQNGYALEYIKNPSKDIQKEAIKQTPWAGKYTNIYDEELQLLLLEHDEYMFEHLPILTVKAQNFLFNCFFNNKNSDFFDEDHLYDLIDNTDFLDKITNFNILLKLYYKSKDETNKQLLKKSKYWKDDANLILEVINE